MGNQRGVPFKIPRSVFLGVLVLGGLASAPSRAATRTVQFSGISGVQAVTPEGQEKADRSLCLVQVMNVGAARQSLDAVGFQVSVSGSGTSVPLSSVRPAEFCIHVSQNGKSLKNPTSCPSDGSKLGQSSGITLEKGDIFYAGLKIDPLMVDQIVHNCSGLVRVSDVNQDRGSVIASGVMTTRQEVRLLDGILSAAYYASGSHIMGGANTALAGTAAFPDPVLSDIKSRNLVSSGSMNLGCVKSCVDFGYSVPFCRLQCGEVSSEVQSPYPEAGTKLQAGIQKGDLSRFFATSAQGVLAPVPLSAYLESTGGLPVGSQFHPAENILIKMPAYSGVRFNSGADDSPSCFSFFPDSQAGFAYSLKQPNDQLGIFSVEANMPNRCRFPRQEITPILRLFSDVPSLDYGTTVGVTAQRSLLPFDPGTEQTGGRDRHIRETIAGDPTRVTGLITPEFVSSNAKGGGWVEGGPSLLNPSSTLTTTNPHFAGGMVYEMTFGPMKSICTAQLAARQQGGTIPTHEGSKVDFETNSNTFPSEKVDNERLLCSHRHGLGDLVFSVGDSSSILINGGRPF